MSLSWWNGRWEGVFFKQPSFPSSWPVPIQWVPRASRSCCLLSGDSNSCLWRPKPQISPAPELKTPSAYLRVSVWRLRVCHVCVCLVNVGLWVFFLFFLVYIRGKWVPPTCRQCVFIDFSKAFPNDVGNFWCFWSSQDSHTVSHLTCPPSVTTLGVDVPLWTHGSSPPPLSINVGLEYASLLQNSAKFLFPPWCWNILCKRAGVSWRWQEEHSFKFLEKSLW